MATPRNDDSRSRLLECALHLFVARGYDGVGVQEIADAADVTKPTLYHYFSSKAGLVEALLSEGLQPLRASLDHAAEYRHDLPLTLTTVAQTYFTFARDHADLCRFHLSLWFAPAESDACRIAVRFHTEEFRVVESLFENAARDHGNMKGRHSVYAVTFLGMLNNYVGLAFNGYVRLNDALVHRAVHQFMHGIFS